MTRTELRRHYTTNWAKDFCHTTNNKYMAASVSVLGLSCQAIELTCGLHARIIGQICLTMTGQLTYSSILSGKYEVLCEVAYECEDESAHTILFSIFTNQVITIISKVQPVHRNFLPAQASYIRRVEGRKKPPHWVHRPS